MSERELIQRATLGDDEALAELLSQYGPKVREHLDGKIDSRWQAVLSVDDVMQETYADAFLDIRKFTPRGEDSFLRWLTTLAKNNLLDALRSLNAAKAGGDRITLSSSRPEADSYFDLFSELGGSTTSVVGAAAKGEAKIALDRAFNQLPPAYREVVSLYDLAGCSAEDTAEACGCTVGAMYMRRNRAHSMLRELLENRSPF